MKNKRISEQELRPSWQPFLSQQQEAVAIRDKTTSTQQLAVDSSGRVTALIVGNGAPPARSIDSWTIDQFSPATVAETLLTVTESVNGAATTTFTSRTITTGKTLRITSLSFILENSGGTPVIMRCYLAIRVNTAGATTASSPLVYRTGLSVIGTVHSMNSFSVSFPDGMEFAGNGTTTIGFSAILPDWVVTTQLAKLSMGVLAYEY